LEGAKAIKTLGSNVIKVFLWPDKYVFNNGIDWPKSRQAAPNLIDMLKIPDFERLFNMDFNTFVIQTGADTLDSHFWADNLPSAKWKNQKKTYVQNYYNAARYLLQKYGNKNKEFVFEQWEADLYYHDIMEDIIKKNPSINIKEVQKRFLEYLAARHEGVQKACKEFPNSRANVYSAVELIWISGYRADKANFKLIDRLDKVKADYISYSIGDDCGFDKNKLEANLAILKSKLNGRPFYIGEVQVPEDQAKELQKEYVLNLIDCALQAGAEYAIIWQIYNNEPQHQFGLIRKDGSKTPLYNTLKEILPKMQIPKEDLYYVIPTHVFFEALGKVEKWLPEDAVSIARGAFISVLKKDFIPPKGWIIHSNRCPNNPGDTIAYKGESVSIWIPDSMPGFSIPKDDLDYIVPTRAFFEALGTVDKWLRRPEDSPSIARGAFISALKKDFIPPKGWIIHTNRCPNNPGDTIAYKGEIVSIWIPDSMPGFSINN